MSAGVSGEVVVLGGVVLGSPAFPPGVVAVSPAPAGGGVESAGALLAGSRGPQAASNPAATHMGMSSFELMSTPEVSRRTPYARFRAE